MIIHRKTRTGCVQCKQRRIKCDEAKPVCERCRRTARECSFSTATASTPTPSTSSPAASSTTRSFILLGGDTFTLKELELFHHYTTVTAFTIGDRPSHERIWQTVVPQLAFKHRFLLNGILAISAMHLSGLREAERESLSVIAANNQDVGLREFQSELSHMTKDNCDALFAFSVLVVCYIPASAGSSINQDTVSSSFLNDVLLDAVIDWVRLIRGVTFIMQGAGQWLETGPLKTILLRPDWSPPVEPESQEYHDEDQYLASLSSLWSGMGKYTEHEREETVIYDAALESLRESFALMNVTESTGEECPLCKRQLHMEETHGKTHIKRLTAGFVWLIFMPQDFFRLLEQRKTIALILFAHHAILLKRMAGPEDWWIKVAPVKILTSVSATLTTEYLPWIAWPRQECLEGRRKSSVRVD